ncbi:hypothetical protein PMAYCL1PPCAC_19618, partial [Pristionchus mayeri]
MNLYLAQRRIVKSDFLTKLEGVKKRRRGPKEARNYAFVSDSLASEQDLHSHPLVPFNRRSNESLNKQVPQCIDIHVRYTKNGDLHIDKLRVPVGASAEDVIDEAGKHLHLINGSFYLQKRVGEDRVVSPGDLFDVKIRGRGGFNPPPPSPREYRTNGVVIHVPSAIIIILWAVSLF